MLIIKTILGWNEKVRFCHYSHVIRIRHLLIFAFLYHSTLFLNWNFLFYFTRSYTYLHIITLHHTNCLLLPFDLHTIYISTAYLIWILHYYITIDQPSKNWRVLNMHGLESFIDVWFYVLFQWFCCEQAFFNIYKLKALQFYNFHLCVKSRPRH
jgi:hypothetical protein